MSFRLGGMEATPEEFRAALDRMSRHTAGMEPRLRKQIQADVDLGFQLIATALTMLDDWRIAALSGTDADRISGFVATCVEADQRLALLASTLQGLGFCPHRENGKEWTDDDGDE